MGRIIPERLVKLTWPIGFFCHGPPRPSRPRCRFADETCAAGAELRRLSPSLVPRRCGGPLVGSYCVVVHSADSERAKAGRRIEFRAWQWRYATDAGQGFAS